MDVQDEQPVAIPNAVILCLQACVDVQPTVSKSVRLGYFRIRVDHPQGCPSSVRTLFTSPFFSRTSPQCRQRRPNGLLPRAEVKKRSAHLGQGQVPNSHTNLNHWRGNTIRSKPKGSTSRNCAIRGYLSTWVVNSNNTQMPSPPIIEIKRVRSRRLSA